MSAEAPRALFEIASAMAKAIEAGETIERVEVDLDTWQSVFVDPEAPVYLRITDPIRGRALLFGAALHWAEDVQGFRVVLRQGLNMLAKIEALRREIGDGPVKVGPTVFEESPRGPGLVAGIPIERIEEAGLVVKDPPEE